ncbi:SDR family NAD(P)-dependent oxidoreductase [Rufibacter sp. XAAS-G3-1]|uniref:SDR family NAD(P)-dependent oxidoreductase n=1 Tax=Rufibacter sp. XAAS-G3-1 TaxID=2729134 RepID=UPI0015E6455A|nr:glucose 1-dehydrogenase [Rufibacter sp. XAAS-G3-1]
MNRLENKVAIITGAASGIGKETALLFAREGAKVTVSDINVENGNKVVEEIKNNGGEAFFVTANVASEEDVRHLVDETVEKFGKLDVFFANAGINIEADVDTLELDKWQKVIDVNLTSTFLCNKYAVQQFKKQGTGGAIVNNGSIHSFVARRGLTAYAASKGGVKMLTQMVGTTYGEDKIRCNMVCPAYIKTPLMDTVTAEIKDQLVGLHPAGRLGEPIEVANAVLFLASDEASFITGTSLKVDGGYTAV